MRRSVFWLAVPLAVLIGLVSALVIWKPLNSVTVGAPPVEELSVESTVLRPGSIELTVRADGSQPMRIAQIQVDGAYRTFAQSPEGPIGRLGTATIIVPFPWVEGDAQHIVLVTSNGVTFEKTIDVASETPTLDRPTLAILTVVGLLLGVTPIAIGLLAYPALRGLGNTGMQFLLALTVGLLAFLLIDTVREGLESAANNVGRLSAQMLVWVSMFVTAAFLFAIGRRGDKPPEGVALSTFIALGIGLHNFGEGLAVGAALAIGSAALANFLVIGFTIHNVTEGVGIAAPLVERRPSLATFAGLAALAGVPAVLGVLLGSNAVSPIWVALSFGVGAGAILQVIVEVGALISRRQQTNNSRTAALGGVAAGLGIMYATALLV